MRDSKHNRLVISASKAIHLTAAFVSILSLEAAMLTAFGGEENPIFRFFVGILIGVTEFIGIAIAYPLYTHITNKERERLAPEILWLSDTWITERKETSSHEFPL